MADTRTEIVDIAEQLIQQVGCNAFSYRDISERIGIKTASIHYHFPSKDDLVLEVISRYRASFNEALLSLREGESSGLKQIQGIGKLVLACFDHGKGFCTAASLASDENTVTNQVRDAVQLFFRDFASAIKKALESARSTGELRDGIDISLTATAAVSLLEGAMLLARTQQSDKPIRDVLRWLEGILTE